MQVCPNGHVINQSYEKHPEYNTNGHVINQSYEKHPEYNKEFCTTCGAKTIIKCPKCNGPIPGKMQNTGAAILGPPPCAPEFCQHCGEEFPWVQHESPSPQARKEREALEEIQNLFSRFHRSFQDFIAL